MKVQTKLSASFQVQDGLTKFVRQFSKDQDTYVISGYSSATFTEADSDSKLDFTKQSEDASYDNLGVVLCNEKSIKVHNNLSPRVHLQNCLTKFVRQFSKDQDTY